MTTRMENDLLDAKEISDRVKQFAYKAKENGIEFNAFKIYRILYDREPSCLHLLDKGGYVDAMKDKYGRIFKKMDQMLEDMKTSDESSIPVQ